MKTKFYVYGLYGVDGELLYIGKVVKLNKGK